MSKFIITVLVSIPSISSFSSFPSLTHCSSRLLNQNCDESLRETNTFFQLKKKGVDAVKATLGVGVSLLGLESITASKSEAKDNLLWKKVDLPTRETLFDIAFDSKNPSHGWVVGAKGFITYLTNTSDM